MATAVTAAAGLAVAYREEVAPYADRVLALAWSGEDAGGAPTEPAAAPPAPQVPVAEVVTREIAPSAEFTGFVAATRSVELRPRVGGAIEAVSVPEGGLVREGQLLFQIDPRPFQVAVETAEAQLRQAEVLLAQAEADFERAEKLVPNGTISRKSYDDALAKRRERQAQVQAAKAAVAAARLDLSYSRVTAPIAGRVDRALVTEGNLVAGGGAGAATVLTTIVSIDPVHVYFDIDEATYLDFVAKARPDSSGRATVRLPVRVSLMTDNGFPHAGVLDFLGNRVDRSTGTVRARAVVPNPDGRLTPGLFARVKLVTDASRQTVLIDDQAVGADQGRRYVLVLGADNKAEYRPVELGPVIDGLRVVTSGLAPGETIIVKGLVRPGMQVAPRPTSMAPGTAPSGHAANVASQEARR
ncbi:secretion protein HlyD [Tistrella mobilis KA081020-065]|uniref:Secretion protein HlyD n=1 Tax=Tistrella mobilis (strain KA081020-065) TaxID=1110502 RepID=I3TMU7_TISMK|nr:secretion protein HlyD [Tistrella mobilis KA081020-065]